MRLTSVPSVFMSLNLYDSCIAIIPQRYIVNTYYPNVFKNILLYSLISSPIIVLAYVVGSYLSYYLSVIIGY